MKNYFGILSMACSVILFAQHAAAEDKPPAELLLTADQTQIISFDELPTTIIVGNPSVADVTSEGRKVFLQPRGYGITNLIVLGASGKKMGDYQVRVIYEDKDSLALYAPNGRSTFTCTRDCEPTMHIGDNVAFSSNYASSWGIINGQSTSVASGDLTTPPETGTTVTTVSGADTQVQ